MILKKSAKAKTTRKRPRKDWREAIRRHLGGVAGVDAVYASSSGPTIHVYSVVENLLEADYQQLLRAEKKIEQAFPKLAFEFHARSHRGDKPTGKESHTSELVFLR